MMSSTPVIKFLFFHFNFFCARGEKKSSMLCRKHCKTSTKANNKKHVNKHVLASDDEASSSEPNSTEQSVGVFFWTYDL